MARIAGVDLPKEKRVEIGLTYIYGIGVASSNKILAKAGVNPDTRVKDLTDDEVNNIRKVIDDSYTVIGSMNFSYSGENKNDENLIVIKNPSIAKFYKYYNFYNITLDFSLLSSIFSIRPLNGMVTTRPMNREINTTIPRTARHFT